jgi:hypothetical protein
MMKIMEATPNFEMDRRSFLASSAAVGGAMVLGFYLPPAAARAAAVNGRGRVLGRLSSL